MKPSSFTGEPVPDPSARVFVTDLDAATVAEWPDATFIVGKLRMREALGNG